MNNNDITVQKKEKKECSGCSACADICPTHAIKMISDEEGFLYPKVNTDLCISCGKCVHVCGFAPTDKTLTPPKAFAVEYSCAMKSHFRKSGNQMSGKWKSSHASLLA